MIEKTILIERFQPGVLFGYTIVWHYSEVWCDMDVFMISYENSDGTFGYGNCSNMTEDFNKAAPCLTGYIKWDGCSELETGPDHHWCGALYVKQHIALLEHVYKKAMELMKQENEWEESK